MPVIRVDGRRVTRLSSAAGAILLVLAGWAVVAGVRLQAGPAIPGPIGGPEIAVDVNTMLRKKGPSFTLRDGDGRVYHVAPGATGRPLVLISHMGFY